MAEIIKITNAYIDEANSIDVILNLALLPGSSYKTCCPDNRDKPLVVYGVDVFKDFLLLLRKNT